MNRLPKITKVYYILGVVCLPYLLPYKLLAQHNIRQYLEQYKGVWQGTLKIWQNNTLQRQLPMELHLNPTTAQDTFDWVLVYPEQPKRNYQLIIKNETQGKCLIDEQNGIILQAQWQGNQLISHFLVQSSHVIAVYRFEKKQIIFEVLMSQTKDAQTTGKDTEQSPQVTGFGNRIYQKAQLRKVK